MLTVIGRARDCCLEGTLEKIWEKLKLSEVKRGKQGFVFTASEALKPLLDGVGGKSNADLDTYGEIE